MRNQTAQQATAAAAASLIPAIRSAWPGLEGSKYAGVSVGEGGLTDGHLVLLADKPPETLNWDAAKAWAESVGGRLPTREESALLYANLRPEFEGGWHWTGTHYSSGYAWGQGFDHGNQYASSKKFEARARAVRRFDASVLQSFEGLNAKAEATTNALLRQLLDESKALRTDLRTIFLADTGA